MPQPWAGVFCALWTAVDAQGGPLVEQLSSHIRFLKQAGVHGSLVMGSTGEFLHFDAEFRMKFFELAREAAGDWPLMANISDVRPKVAIKLGLHARSVGAKAVAILPPYFFPLAQCDLAEYFIAIGEAVQLPVFLYNFPERTGNRISVETVAAVSQRIELAGIKQSGGEFKYHSELALVAKEHGLALLTGSDTQLAEAMALGSIGCVSGLANAVPELVVQVFQAVQQGQPESAAAAREKMTELGKLIQIVEFPFNVGAAIEARGFSPGAPKICVSPQTHERYVQLVKTLREKFEGWGLTR
jgi:dihydrodipicolinate synthase/N-acetylneuraminate lyase